MSEQQQRELILAERKLVQEQLIAAFRELKENFISVNKALEIVVDAIGVWNVSKEAIHN